MKRPAIVSIQSQVVFGCAGNSAAVPLWQRLGASVYAVPTTVLSNTPHYPTIAGGPMDTAVIEGLLQRLLERVEPSAIDAIATGYMASPGAVVAASHFIDHVREQHPEVVVICDPVMGDTDYGFFVEAEVAAAIVAELVPRADILTPNAFEASHLTGLPADNHLAMIDALLANRASIAAITGIETADDRVATVAATRGGRWMVETPRLQLRPTGTGDSFAAVFLHALLGTGKPERALEQAVAAVYALLEACHAAGGEELEPGEFKPPADGAAPMFPAHGLPT